MFQEQIECLNILLFLNKIFIPTVKVMAQSLVLVDMAHIIWLTPQLKFEGIACRTSPEGQIFQKFDQNFDYYCW